MDQKPTKLLNETEAAEYLGISVRTIQGFRPRRLGPAFIKVGGAVRYKLSDLEIYIEGHRVVTDDANDRR